jgi:predicted transposase YdaD
VSAIPKPHLAAAADVLPEPTKETFMTAAQEWMLEGMEKGLEKGREEGRQEGEHTALVSTLTQLIRLRFRALPPEVTPRIEAASKAELQCWIERILTAETLDDLLA